MVKTIQVLRYALSVYLHYITATCISVPPKRVGLDMYYKEQINVTE